MDDDGLASWIEGVRDRLARGDLDGFGPIEVEDGTRAFPAAQVVRIMLIDLDDLDRADRAGGDPAWRGERRRQLTLEFRRLRELID